MKILVVEPRKRPRRANIPHTLEDMQRIVGGYIEIIGLFEDPCVLVCDEEGKIKGYEANRLVGQDIIAGTFFIAGVEDGDLTDISDDYADKYATLLRYPQVFIRTPVGVLALSENGAQELISAR